MTDDSSRIQRTASPFLSHPASSGRQGSSFRNAHPTPSGRATRSFYRPLSPRQRSPSISQPSTISALTLPSSASPPLSAPQEARVPSTSLRLERRHATLLGTRQVVPLEEGQPISATRETEFNTYTKSVSLSPEALRRRQLNTQQLAAGIQKSASLENSNLFSQLTRANCSRHNLVTSVLDFLTCHRTERALRFIIPLPLVLYLSYHPHLMGLSMTQLIVILYLLQATLLPPLFVSVSLIWFMALPAVLIALSIVSIVWVLDSQVAEGVRPTSSADAWTLVFLFACFLIVGKYKLSPLTNLLSIGFLVCIYVTEFALISSTHRRLYATAFMRRFPQLRRRKCR
eukprot:Gregarina_sp_Poly_1__7558@NODE_422_length_8655_cov_206_021076_g344_i0_p2_GENE_NODE_422_length_8655_cov_206_021076_g344_i0NODE_422_length_8655_cov_206_021076_g344_i0_p2_ORF_typecomplete_len343_score24_34_NODE_422_length_8655_cov_206_021076_g344_i041765204